MPNPAPVNDLEGLWSCFSCDYVGPDMDDDVYPEGACPECGTRSGDGFGMAENDPRFVQGDAAPRR